MVLAGIDWGSVFERIITAAIMAVIIAGSPPGSSCS